MKPSFEASETARAIAALPGGIAGASLKQQRDGERRVREPALPGGIAGASLKPTPPPPRAASRSCPLPGGIAGASLKRIIK